MLTVRIRPPTRVANSDDKRTDWLEPSPEEEGLRRYVETIRERLWLVILAVTLTTAMAVAYVVTAPKTYEAQADILITPITGDDPTLLGLGLLQESTDPTRDVETAARLVTNNEVAERARQAVGLDESARALLDRVEAEPVAQSNIVAVTAEGDSPAEARDLANAFGESAVAARTEAFHNSIELKVQRLADPGEIAELQGLQGTSDPTFRLETEADLPTQQASPRPALSVAAGVIAGLVLGIAAAFASQVLDPRLRREEQLRRRFNLPILARIPRERAARHLPITPRRISRAAAEAYRMLRSTLERSASRGGKVILVTGPSAAEGKTTTALNLASSLAVAGRRVILIEADLRRPSLAQTLSVDGRAGVVSVLIENAALHDALSRTPTYGENLKLLLADYSGGWIADLFSVPAAMRLIDDARKMADFVVIDSPPLTEVIDAMPFARRADDVLIVTRLGKSRLDKIVQLAELLADNGIRPVGFAVIGLSRPSRRDYHYYAGSRDGRASRSLFRARA
jgi:polysaccharide biosynthesis transport protein